MFKIKHFWQIDLPCVTPQELLYVSVTGFKGSGIGVKASLTTLMIACFIPAHQAHSEQILLWREKQCSRSSYSFKTSFQKGDKPFCHSNLPWKCIRSPQFRTWLYSRLSSSRIPRESLKYFEISVHRHIRFAVKEKKWIEQQHLTNVHVYVIWLLNLEICWKYCGKEEKLLFGNNFYSFPQYFVTC